MDQAYHWYISHLLYSYIFLIAFQYSQPPPAHFSLAISWYTGSLIGQCKRSISWATFPSFPPSASRLHSAVHLFLIVKITVIARLKSSEQEISMRWCVPSAAVPFYGSILNGQRMSVFTSTRVRTLQVSSIPLLYHSSCLSTYLHFHRIPIATFV
jgi:hypothetical protein